MDTRKALGMYDATMPEQEDSAEDGADIPPMEGGMEN
jgi:hypothetical protein